MCVCVCVSVSVSVCLSVCLRVIYGYVFVPAYVHLYTYPYIHMQCIRIGIMGTRPAETRVLVELGVQCATPFAPGQA